jgi:hypothetical protein
MIFGKQINQVIEKSDILLEVLDARFVNETRNRTLEKRIKLEGKTLIYVVNKVDLVNSRWLHERIKDLDPVVRISCKERLSTGILRAMIKRYAKKVGKTFVGIIGYPNTGKSSLVNIMCGKARAKTSPQSGMTRSIQHIRLSEDIMLVDSPGTFANDDTDALVLISSIDFSKVEDPVYYVNLIQERFTGVIERYYTIESLEDFAHKRGYLKKGGIIDEEKAARIILKDWQQGRIHV